LLNDITGPAPSPMAYAASNMVCRAVPTSTSTTLFWGGDPIRRDSLPIDADHHRCCGMLDHPGRDHAQQAQRDRPLDGNVAVESAITPTGGPACGFEDRDEL
jgi:hypothetical protein